MADFPQDDPIQSEMTIARWLFNPFIRVDGTRALLIGLGVIVATGGPAAALGGVHFDGLPDFTPTYGAPAWVPVGEGLVTWFVFSVFIGLVARVLAPRPVHFVDIAGPQALARFPLFVAALLCSLPVMRRANAEMLASVAEGGSIVPPPAWAFFVAAFIGFASSGGMAMRSHRRRTWMAMLFAVAVTGSAACGDDGGSPTAPTPTVPPVVDAQSDEDAARQSVDAWLALLDAGNYSEAYDATGSFFQESVTAGEFRNKMEERQTILGAVESRTLSSTQRLSTVPDAPPGDYFVFEFDGVYERRPNARERVTAVSESDAWPVVGIYLIR